MTLKNVALIYFKIVVLLSIRNICFQLFCENYHIMDTENTLTNSDSRSVSESDTEQLVIVAMGSIGQC